jgi:hypothetical protein
VCVESTRRGRELRAYRAALNLYAGDLSPEDRYEEWAEARREEMRRLYLSSIVELATLYEGPGKFGCPVRPRAEAQVAPWHRNPLTDEQQDEWRRRSSSRHR